MKLTQIQMLAEQAANDADLERIIEKTLFFVGLFHSYHWQTKSYAAHTALGEFYETLQEEVDKLAEAYMGAGNELKPSGVDDLKMDAFSVESARKLLETYKEELTAAESRIMADEKSPYHAAADVMVDLLAATDKLLYLLTLE